MNFASILTESSLQGYLPYNEPGFDPDNKTGLEIYKILKDYRPDKHLWQSVWCDGTVLHKDGADLLANALMYTCNSFDFHRDLGDGSYIRGSVGYDHSGMVLWIRWGVGCPMDSGCDEILVPVYVE